MKQPPSHASDRKNLRYAFGTLQLEPDGTLLRGETPIHLPPKELEALRLLLAHAGEVVSPSQLKEALWGDVNVTADSVPRCLSSLRARLEPDDCIQTIYKRGYRFTASLRPLPDKPALLRLAILPFAVGPHVAAHLGPAIAEEVTTALTRMQPPLVSVLARDSVFTLALSGATAQKTGQVLQADLVLTGTLLALPSSFRLRAEMIRVADGTQIWVEDLLVSRDWTMGLELQVLERLAFRLGGHTSLDLAPVVAQSPINSSQSDAYEMFQRGHHEWQTLERHRMQDGMQHLLKAIELDPALLPAHIDLVNLCVTQTLFGFMPSITAADRIRRIASAIPDVVRAAPSILPALGWVDFHVDRDLSHAIKLFDQSAHLPHDPWITRLRAMFAISRHHFDEAAELMNQALEVDPYSPWLHARLAWAYHLAGKPNESMIQIEQSLKLFPQHESTSMYGALILAFNGDTRRAARLAKDLVDRTPYFDIATAVQAYALAREGDAAGARTMLERLQWLSRERFVLSSFTAGAFAALGDEENAISELRTSEKTRCPWFFQMLADPRLKSLQGHPEFERMRSTLDTLEINAGDYHVLCT